MGPSGAWKTTLLSILGMLDGDWEGEYSRMEHPVHKMNLEQRAELGKQTVGFVFQQYHLLDGLTVAENLDIPLSYRNIKASERQALVADGLGMREESSSTNAVYHSGVVRNCTAAPLSP